METKRTGAEILARQDNIVDLNPNPSPTGEGRKGNFRGYDGLS